MPRKKEPTCVTENYIFPKRLRKLMENRWITQKALADAINMRPQTVSLYTTGQSFPDVNTLKKIAEFFNISADYLIGVSDVQGLDPDIKFICKYTGLPESSIQWIHSISKKKDLIEALSQILQRYPIFEQILKDIVELKRISQKIPHGHYASTEPSITPEERAEGYFVVDRLEYYNLLRFEIEENLKGIVDVAALSARHKELFDFD